MKDRELLERQLENKGEMGLISVKEALRIFEKWNTRHTPQPKQETVDTLNEQINDNAFNSAGKKSERIEANFI